ncbi:ATP-binding protein [Nocardia crassostreae]|uniref:ATP-binding protein n=1 Tax=Nocardia crassostreae TaxID=53428 RepID=UPI0012F8E522|nr:ATP-binding protein [Nocardia crassostreae]
MTGDITTGEQTRSPRALFTIRFTELYEAAGNPTLRRVAAAAETRMRAAQGTRPGGASAQRISDWKAGRNVPARFESLLPVVLTLADLARKSGRPLTRELAEPREWQRLWQAATTWNPEDEADAACPYPGLNSYRPHNRSLFFGRTRATTELTALVHDATGIVAVVGASGAGKSSLLAAGLTPAFDDREIITLTPGRHPLRALLNATRPTPSTEQESGSTDQDTPASSSNPGTVPDSGAVPGRPAASEPTPADTLSALAPRRDLPRRLLIIDQFEELFTACADERAREDFLTALDRCATRTDDPITVVIALRADFYAHCLNYLILQEALEHRAYLLGPMRTDELAQAISCPARAVGLDLESGLEELVITELCGAGGHPGRRTYDPGALPLLSHVMAATWQHREGRRLTITGYRKAGGVVGSVAETAEHAWTELSSTQQAAAKEILLGLVTVGQDSHDTRRIAQRPDLLRRNAAPEDATAALELLARTRLITLDADAVTLTHEIVLTAWPRLRTWIDEDRVGYLVRQRLETDAAEWAAQDRDSSLLYRGTRLRTALDNANPPPGRPCCRRLPHRRDHGSHPNAPPLGPGKGGTGPAGCGAIGPQLRGLYPNGTGPAATRRPELHRAARHRRSAAPDRPVAGRTAVPGRAGTTSAGRGREFPALADAGAPADASQSRSCRGYFAYDLPGRRHPRDNRQGQRAGSVGRPGPIPTAATGPIHPRYRLRLLQPRPHPDGHRRDSLPVGADEHADLGCARPCRPSQTGNRFHGELLAAGAGGVRRQWPDSRRDGRNTCDPVGSQRSGSTSGRGEVPALSERTPRYPPPASRGQSRWAAVGCPPHLRR